MACLWLVFILVTRPKLYPLQWFSPKNALFTAVSGIFSTGTYAGIGTQIQAKCKALSSSIARVKRERLCLGWINVKTS